MSAFGLVRESGECCEVVTNVGGNYARIVKRIDVRVSYYVIYEGVAVIVYAGSFGDYLDVAIREYGG